MKIKELESKIGGCSNTSKMPWISWSISAKECNVGGNLAKQENTVCMYARQVSKGINVLIAEHVGTNQ